VWGGLYDGFVTGVITPSELIVEFYSLDFANATAPAHSVRIPAIIPPY
jgi:hypothetical protein